MYAELMLPLEEIEQRRIEREQRRIRMETQLLQDACDLLKLEMAMFCGGVGLVLLLVVVVTMLGLA